MTRLILALALAASLGGCVPAISMAVDYLPLPDTASRNPVAGTEVERPANCPGYATLVPGCTATPPAS